MPVRYTGVTFTHGSPGPPPPAGAGKINTLDQWATGSEPYVGNPANYPFYLDKIDRALVYGGSPSQVHDLFAAHGWEYNDSVAIYASSPPNFATYSADVLREQANQANYTWLTNYYPGSPAGTQYAADPGLAAWRSTFQGFCVANAAAGYVGTMIDDVNPGAINTVNASNVSVVPHDARTNAGMTLADWRRYHAEFIEQMKAAVPASEIVSNMHWYAGNSGAVRGYNDPYIQRLIAASDQILLENPLSGMTGDSVDWTFSFPAFRNFVDYCHSRSTGVAFFNYDGTIDREYVLAMYFLLSESYDYVGVILTSGNPATYNTMYDINLGSATSTRYTWSNLWRRDFTGGFILLNGPGAATQTNVALGGSFVNTSGATVTTVTLAAERGAVLRNP